MVDMKTAAALCTGLTLVTGCSQKQHLSVSEVTRTDDGRYMLMLEDKPGEVTVVPEHIITEHGVFRRADDVDMGSFFERYVKWPVAPENKLDAFGSTYYKLDEAAAAKVKK